MQRPYLWCVSCRTNYHYLTWASFSTTSQSSQVTNHRQAVRVPAEPPLHMEAWLVRPARDYVLDGAGENVAVVGQARGEGRPVVETESEEGGQYSSYLLSTNKDWIWRGRSILVLFIINKQRLDLKREVNISLIYYQQTKTESEEGGQY